jgi:hypothetical protein
LRVRILSTFSRDRSAANIVGNAIDSKSVNFQSDTVLL